MARILILDDDEAFRELLAIGLSRAGHLVSQAADGKEGVEVFAKEPVEIVITDLLMPNQEGLETIAILTKQAPGIPVIAMSGSRIDSPLYLDIARKMGARVTLSKPFSIEKLLKIVDEIVSEFDPEPKG